MLRPNGGRQALRKTAASIRPDNDSPGPGAGLASSPPPLPERQSVSSPPIPGTYVEHTSHPEFDADDLDAEFGGEIGREDGGEAVMGDSFHMYGHSNDSADLYSINSTSGFRETTEELDGLAVENMVLREDYGRLSLFLQRNHPDIYTQYTSQSSHLPTQLNVSYSETPPPSQPQHPPPPPPAPQRNPSLNSIPTSPNPNPSTTSLQSLLKRKEHDLTALYALRTQQDSELTSLRKQVKGLHDFIIQSRNKTQALEGIVELDDVYFEREFKQLAASVRDWCWKLSRGAGIFIGDEEDREVVTGAGRGKFKEGLREPCLNKSEIERLMKTHSKIGVITAFVVDKIWWGCWGRYAPGLSDKEEEVLRALEGEMRKSDKIPMASINRWRASTLALLSKSPSTPTTITTQTTTLASSITQTLSRLLIPPATSTNTNPPGTTTTRPTPADERSLTRILEKAMTLYSQLRAQRARFELVYPSKGDGYDCRAMEDAGDIVVYDEEDLMGGKVGAVAFPGVIKWGEEQEGGRCVVVAPSEAGGEVNPGQGEGVVGGGGATSTGGGKPRVLVKARVLCMVPEEPDE